MKDKKDSPIGLFILKIILLVIILIGILWFVSIPIFFPEPTFKIIKNELITSQEVYDYCIDYCKKNPNHIGCVTFPCSTLIKKVEVEDIRIEWFERCERDNCEYCIEGEKDCKKSILVLKEKEDLTIDWLGTNCVCVEECPPRTEVYKGHCHHKSFIRCDKKIEIGNAFRCSDSVNMKWDCKNYKCREDYFVEVLK